MSLFDNLIYEKRQTPDEAAFQEENLSLLLTFPSLTEECMEFKAKELLSRIPVDSRDRNLHAVLMSGLLKGKLINMFPHYCREATHGRFRLRTEKGQWIYVKKLDDKLRPMNIETEQNMNILNQVSFSKADKGANIFLGYTSDKGNSQITGAYAICLDGDVLLWGINLFDLVASQGARKRQMQADVQQPQFREDLVKLKERKDASGQS